MPDIGARLAEWRKVTEAGVRHLGSIDGPNVVMCAKGAAFVAMARTAMPKLLRIAEAAEALEDHWEKEGIVLLETAEAALLEALHAD